MCKHHQVVQNRAKIYSGGSCARLVYSITPTGAEVKGGGYAVHWSSADGGAKTLDLRSHGVLIRHPIFKVDCQLRMDHAPILPPACPFLRDIDHGKVPHFQQAVIGGKHEFCLGYFAKLTVEALDGIGRVDEPPNLLGIFEVVAEIRPILPPGLRNFWIFLVPAPREGVQSVHGDGLIHCGINRLQIGHKRFRVLVGYIFAGISELVDDMNEHNYGPDDFETYSQDPKWRELQTAAFPDYELPPVNEAVEGVDFNEKAFDAVPDDRKDAVLDTFQDAPDGIKSTINDLSDELTVGDVKDAASRIKLLIGKVSDKKANKEIEKAYDLLHSSPSRSVATVKLLEQQIKNKIDELEGAIYSNDTAAVITISGEIINLTEERNRKIRLSN